MYGTIFDSAVRLLYTHTNISIALTSIYRYHQFFSSSKYKFIAISYHLKQKQEIIDFNVAYNLLLWNCCKKEARQTKLHPVQQQLMISFRCNDKCVSFLGSLWSSLEKLKSKKTRIKGHMLINQGHDFYGREKGRNRSVKKKKKQRKALSCILQCTVNYISPV